MRDNLTADRIWQFANSRSTTLRGEVRIINRLFEAQDDSSLWPINGKFNVTRRAIRRLQRRQRLEVPFDDGYGYALALEDEISNIVNDERNWDNWK